MNKLFEKMISSISEKDLEEYLYNNPRLAEFNFAQKPIDKWIARQLVLPSGILDLLGVIILESGTYIVVVELKKAQIDSRALSQVCRYADDISRIVGHLQMEGEVRSNIIVKKVCIGIGGLSDEKTLYEADSMGVIIHEFNFNVSLSGGFDWTNEARDRYYHEIEVVSELDIWQALKSPISIPAHIASAIEV